MLRVRRILLPTDRSAWSEHVFTYAAYLAGRTGAALHLLHVSPDGPAEPVESVGADAGDFRQWLHEAAAEAVGVDVVFAEVGARLPADGILDYAADRDVDLVVMATHGRRGLAHFAKGSVAEAVVRRAPCPVLTVRPSAPVSEPDVDRVLCPVDFTAEAWRAVAHARELAALFGAEVHLLHVVSAGPGIGFGELPPPPARPEDLAEAEQALRELYAEAGGPDIPHAVHAVGDTPVFDVARLADELEAGLVVMASHDRGAIERALLGSVAERAVREAPCPVLVLRGEGKGLLVAGREEAAAR